jgi:lipopolysaccharide transport system ATP-binding protein
MGPAKEVVRAYLEKFARPSEPKEWPEPSSAPGNELVRLKKTSVQAMAQGFISVASPIQVYCEFWCLTKDITVNVNVVLYGEHGECVFNIGSSSVKAQHSVLSLEVVIPPKLLNNQTYTVSLTVVKNHSEAIFEFPNCVSFEVQDERQGLNYFGAWPGVIRPAIDNNLRIKELIDSETSNIPDSVNA